MALSTASSSANSILATRPGTRFSHPDFGTVGASSLANSFYFCIPQNDNLLAYWDTVADRLFKIRNCMNIEGAVRELPLFAPPIDPALLVRAVAMGVDLSSALNNINAAIPRYRFTYMLQKALELCAEVKALGGALLAVLEKKDAEALAVLRAGQETNVLKAVQRTKERQIEEAGNTLDGLNRYRDVVTARRDYYQNIVRISDEEQTYMDALGTAHVFNEIAQGIHVGVAAAHLFPNFDTGTAGWCASPVVKASFGGNNLGSGLQAAAGVMSMIAAQFTHDATMASIKGGYDRRWDDWKQSAKLAAKELDQINKQIAAAMIRVAITELELENQRKQIDNASTIEEFLRSRKYTNQELYDWMVTQTSNVFFQSYQIAYAMAKRAERAFRFERGLTAPDYVHFGYWDSRRSGLLAGEQLNLDLKRMEVAYLDQNKRDYEITKHISLVLNDPMALIGLKETGQCIVNLPEVLFDADYCGHFMRRIRSVSLSIPCVTGPYTSINCTLTLLKSSIRLSSKPTGSEGRYTRDHNSDDQRFVDNFSAVESIATSHAQNDSGMFELNFRDERYLPFEGAGAISTWRIEMPQDNNAFDFQTMSDAILNLNYTARDGGSPLRAAARDALGLDSWTNPVGAPTSPDLLRMFSLKHEFPTDWYRFLHPSDTAASQTMTFSLSMERFPFQLRGKAIQISQVNLFLKFKDINDQNNYAKGDVLTLYLMPPGDPPPVPSGGALVPDHSLDGLPHATIQLQPWPAVGSWLIEARDADVQSIAASLRTTITAANGPHFRLKPELLDDLVMVLHFSAGST